MDPAEQAVIDSIFQGKAYGGTAARLLQSGMNVNSLRPWIGGDDRCYVREGDKAVPTVHATLRKDEWKHYDQAVLEAATLRLVGVQDLYSRGLTYNLTNGMGTTVLEYEDMSDIEDAEMNMDGATRGRNDRPEFDLNYLPLPIVHKDFQINARVLAASRTTGQPLDTTMAGLSGRKIAEKLESILFTGASTYAYGGGTIYGYTDFPNRATGSLTGDWASSTGAEILTDVKAMKQASIDNRYHGPWMLYIPTSYETALDGDYVAGYPKTIRKRILEVAGIIDVKVADYLTDGSVLLVQMTPDVVRMVNGMPISTVEWNVDGGMIFHFKVMTIQVPQLRADQEDRCGIVHYSE